MHCTTCIVHRALLPFLKEMDEKEARHPGKRQDYTLHLSGGMVLNRGPAHRPLGRSHWKARQAGCGHTSFGGRDGPSCAAIAGRTRLTSSSCLFWSTGGTPASPQRAFFKPDCALVGAGTAQRMDDARRVDKVNPFCFSYSHPTDTSGPSQKEAVTRQRPAAVGPPAPLPPRPVGRPHFNSARGTKF